MAENRDVVLAAGGAAIVAWWFARRTGGTGGSIDVGTPPFDPSQTYTIAEREGLMDQQSLRIVETDNLEEANDDGTRTVNPGETVTLARIAPGFRFALLAAGASDSSNVQYRLVADQDRVIGGTTGSPLGTVNSPLSFVEEYGAAIEINQEVEYRARLDESAGSSVDLVARLHAETVQ